MASRPEAAGGGFCPDRQKPEELQGGIALQHVAMGDQAGGHPPCCQGTAQLGRLPVLAHQQAEPGRLEIATVQQQFEHDLRPPLGPLLSQACFGLRCG